MFFSNLPKIESSEWVNCEHPPEIEGKIVLVDFFTYSCVNCLRTLNHMRQLHRNYASKGLVIIGVHTPEFEFEKSPENLQMALEKYKISWPVVIDNSHEIWHAFSNKYWPAKYLANEKGKIVYTHFGEGKYLETENEIRELLGLEPLDKSEFKIEDPYETFGEDEVRVSPEIYLGYHRGKPVQDDDHLVYDSEYNFARATEITEDRYSLSGQFLLRPEFVESVNYNSKLLLNFSGHEVNLVIVPVDESCKIELFLDGEPLFKKTYGKDVGEDGKILIDGSRMYNLVRDKDGVSGVLTVQAFEGNFRAFAFTFG